MSTSVARNIMLLFCLRILDAQTVSPTPGFLQHIGGQIPVPEQFSFELEFQLGMQGNSGNGNPFAYTHGLQFRPWIHYDGVPNLTVTGAASYIYHFTVPGTSHYRHPEWRFTIFGTLKQSLDGGSLYEQVRFELRSFRASNGDVQHLPRIRFRFGQNLYFSEHPSKPYLGIYEEAILQFPQPSYSHRHFQGARFFVGYGFDYAKENDRAARIQGGGRGIEERVDSHIVLWTCHQPRLSDHETQDERKASTDNCLQGLLMHRIVEVPPATKAAQFCQLPGSNKPSGDRQFAPSGWRL